MPLRNWFYAVYLISSTQCRITARDLQQKVGVSYNTARRMSEQIRLMILENPDLKRFDEIEVDDRYFGGVRKKLQK